MYSMDTCYVATTLCVQTVERQIEVLSAQVDELKSTVDRAVHEWGLEEVKRPYNHIRTQLTELQHSAAVR